MSSLDVAGVVGTWVAALIAIVALIGIVGPILIWRASRTERHQALAAVSDTDHEFISKGIHAGPNIWLLRRVRAPLLDKKPTSIDSSFVLNLSSLNGIKSSEDAGWVNLARLIKAYGVLFPRGDNLVLKRFDMTLGMTLPVHKLWLLAVGLTGRYGYRRDKGRFREANRGNRHTQSLMQVAMPSERTASLRPERHNFAMARPERGDQDRTLYGITGSFEAWSSEKQTFYLRFTLATNTELEQQVPDVVSPQVLFMLACGLMPLSGNRAFLLPETEMEVDDQSSASTDSRSQHRGGPAARPARNYYSHRMRREPDRRQLRAYQLLPTAESVLIDATISKSFNVNDIDFTIFSQLRYSRSLSAEMEEYDVMMYLPADAAWIRLPRDFAGSFHYIAREDAHEIAHSLLIMEWHPESYLLWPSTVSIGMRLLTSAASRFQAIATRILDGIDKFGLGAHEQSTIRAVLVAAERRIEKRTGPDRTTASIFYKLDHVLEEFCQKGDRLVIDRMIGILMITNDEFRDLFYQSLRHLSQATQSTVRVDPRAATVSIPSAFGVLQTFQLDLDRMYPSQTRISSEAVAVPYSVVVLAALKSCTRSQMLMDCFNARPLIDLIREWTDIVYVGA